MKQKLLLRKATFLCYFFTHSGICARCKSYG